MDDPVLYEKLIYENIDKGYQFKLVLNEFREQYYIHIRKYFLSYEGEFIPSKEGISMPVTISNVLNLTDALLDICSQVEGEDLIKKHFIDKLNAKPNEVS